MIISIFSTLVIPDNWNIFFLNNLNDTSRLLLFNFLVPSLHFQKSLTFELRWKKFRLKKICYVYSRGFYFLLCSTHFKTEYPLLCNFFWTYASLQRPLFWLCVWCLTQLCSQIEIGFIYFWLNCSYRAAPY